MTAMPSTLAQERPEPSHLVIPANVAAALPESVRDQLAAMPAAQQAEFLEAFRRRSANLIIAYLLSLIYCHYAALGRCPAGCGCRCSWRARSAWSGG